MFSDCLYNSIRFIDLFGHLNIYRINESRKLGFLWATDIRPYTKNKANDGCRRNGHKPRWNVEVTMTVPRTDVKLSILFVT